MPLQGCKSRHAKKLSTNGAFFLKKCWPSLAADAPSQIIDNNLVKVAKSFASTQHLKQHLVISTDEIIEIVQKPSVCLLVDRNALVSLLGDLHAIPSQE